MAKLSAEAQRAQKNYERLPNIRKDEAAELSKTPKKSGQYGKQRSDMVYRNQMNKSNLEHGKRTNTVNAASVPKRRNSYASK